MQNILFHFWRHKYINLKEIIKILNLYTNHKQYDQKNCCRYWKRKNISQTFPLYKYIFLLFTSIVNIRGNINFVTLSSTLFIHHSCPSIERFTRSILSLQRKIFEKSKIEEQTQRCIFTRKHEFLRTCEHLRSRNGELRLFCLQRLF